MIGRVPESPLRYEHCNPGRNYQEQVEANNPSNDVQYHYHPLRLATIGSLRTTCGALLAHRHDTMKARGPNPRRTPAPFLFLSRHHRRQVTLGVLGELLGLGFGDGFEEALDEGDGVHALGLGGEVATDAVA